MKLLPIALIGIGGYFLYRAMGTPEPTLPRITTAAGETTKALVLARAGSAGPFNYDDWNWYYREALKKEPPDVLLYVAPENRGDPVSIDTWYAGASQHGLSSLRRRRVG